jgi:hypothetical protein
MVNEIGTIDGTLYDVYLGNDFKDLDNQDYHLKAGSSFIDQCTPIASTLDEITHDYDGLIRPFDDASVDNFAGATDVGAYETHINDLIFKSSF